LKIEIWLASFGLNPRPGPSQNRWRMPLAKWNNTAKAQRKRRIWPGIEKAIASTVA
jgi:hypothetical protein